jgi:putative transposase
VGRARQGGLAGWSRRGAQRTCPWVEGEQDSCDGVTLAGEKDILGLWAGTGGEGAKFWMSVLTDLRNRGVRDVFFVVCDGLKGLPDVVTNVWPQTIVQTCIIHLIRNTFRLSSR